MIYSEPLISMELSAVMDNNEVINYNLIIKQYGDQPKTITFMNVNELREFIRQQIREVT